MNDLGPQGLRHGALLRLMLRYVLPASVAVAGGMTITFFLFARTGPNHSVVDVGTEREAMRAIGAATHQWQLYFGDAVCPSIRQLIERRSVSATARKLDAWEQPYIIRCMDTEVTVSSSGPDRARDTPDDIVVSVSRRK